jgi:endonuclease/exonuclease/phosphatase family metal-dependent hydrolase
MHQWRAFCNQLHRECSKIPKYDMLVILGDFNAQTRIEVFLKMLLENTYFILQQMILEKY